MYWKREPVYLFNGEKIISMEFDGGTKIIQTAAKVLIVMAISLASVLASFLASVLMIP
jgi:hypothetical protein